MHKWTIAAAGLCLSGITACTSFLSSGDAIADPNNPTVATRDQLFVGTQAQIFANEEGPLALLICEWMQGCAGVNGRFVEQQGSYNIDATSFDVPFQNVYNGGGLIGIRAVQASADTAGDQLYKGIAEVIEAMDMLFAADIWGDVPYRFAVSDSVTPPFDPQMQIYDDLLVLLDKAIVDMNGPGDGPKAYDLIYAGDRLKWIDAAHTIKARIYLHRAEKLGVGEYAKAVAEARLGIKQGGDWLTRHTSVPSERNMWVQFHASSFGSDIVAGAALVDTMKSQADPRLKDYFAHAPDGQYHGYDVSTGLPSPDQVSPLAGSTRASNIVFPQPVMTYYENQLIIAEAALQTGDRAASAAAYNAIRFDQGKPTTTPAAIKLNDIMTEKYIVMFQNRETWNDFKRTCMPALHPARGRPIIPGRVYYGATEEQTNPHSPGSAQQDLRTVRNANDPAACPP